MSFTNLISTNPNCSKCPSKYALTKCIKGTLCQECGSRCHGKFQHPVEFILQKCSEGKLRKNPTVKSMVALSKANIKDTPLRFSKLMARNKILTINFEGKPGKKSEFDVSADGLKQNKKKLSLKISKSRVRLNEAPKDKIHEQQQQQIIANSSAISSYEAVEVVRLRTRVAEQAKVIELMKEKLQAQRKRNKQNQKLYEQKLRIIRKMRH